MRRWGRRAACLLGLAWLRAKGMFRLSFLILEAQERASGHPLCGAVDGKRGRTVNRGSPRGVASRRPAVVTCVSVSGRLCREQEASREGGMHWLREADRGQRRQNGKRRRAEHRRGAMLLASTPSLSPPSSLCPVTSSSCCRGFDAECRGHVHGA